MNERQPNSQEPSTQPIGKNIRGSSELFSLRADDVISEACLTAMIGDRRDEPAAIDLSMIAVANTIMNCTNFKSCQFGLNFSSFLFCF